MICAACKRRGHPASSCDMLAIAFFVDHHKNHLSENEKLSIKEKWIAHWKDKVGHPNCMPHQVMRANCEELDISANHLDDAMDWECWPAGAEETSDDE